MRFRSNFRKGGSGKRGHGKHRDVLASLDASCPVLSRNSSSKHPSSVPIFLGRGRGTSGRSLLNFWENSWKNSWKNSWENSCTERAQKGEEGDTGGFFPREFAAGHSWECVGCSRKGLREVMFDPKNQEFNQAPLEFGKCLWEEFPASSWHHRAGSKPIQTPK